MKSADEINSYYIAYVYERNDGGAGFGNLIISNVKEITMETLEEIRNTEKFIREQTLKIKNLEIKNVVIMDFRKLKEEL